ncbi:squalene/phytoene synthase family protein [Brevundimonas fontaquae]|uniref:Squalene/phytoene synthase family protein n=1 Tax=Brevundimonas fontaquae TaxID=2813778 RepID=A0ABX7LS21_9CAUL|nr:squalene/phytoene synthase family protein [Brevundimonas fontaquae]QSF55613.1 squalene/phytoene synthase family protein [Brevundimonas fontaquae]
MTETADTLDQQVRTADLDRWLSSRLVADDRARADLITLYALEAELMTIPTRVTQPLLAEMRYTWWAEQMDGVFAGVPRKGHPVLEALTDLVARHGLDRAPFDALIDAHIGRVREQPHDLDAFYVGPMQVGVRILAGEGHDAAVAPVGLVWGLAQTGRAKEASSLKRAANGALKRLPPEGFPAVAHAALTDPDRAEPLKRLRLIAASLVGRI